MHLDTATSVRTVRRYDVMDNGQFVKMVVKRDFVWRDGNRIYHLSIINNIFRYRTKWCGHIRWGWNQINSSFNCLIILCDVIQARLSSANEVVEATNNQIYCSNVEKKMFQRKIKIKKEKDWNYLINSIACISALFFLFITQRIFEDIN